MRESVGDDGIIYLNEECSEMNKFVFHFKLVLLIPRLNRTSSNTY